jgi:hypothetical protein
VSGSNAFGLHDVIGVSSLNAMTPCHRYHFRVDVMMAVGRSPVRFRFACSEAQAHLRVALALAPIRYGLLTHYSTSLDFLLSSSFVE